MAIAMAMAMTMNTINTWIGMKHLRGRVTFYSLLSFGKLLDSLRKKCINLYSPDKDNRYLRLASFNIIENRGGVVQRVGRSSVRGSESIRDSLVE